MAGNKGTVSAQDLLSIGCKLVAIFYMLSILGWLPAYLFDARAEGWGTFYIIAGQFIPVLALLFGSDWLAGKLISGESVFQQEALMSNLRPVVAGVVLFAGITTILNILPNVIGQVYHVFVGGDVDVWSRYFLTGPIRLVLGFGLLFGASMITDGLVRWVKEGPGYSEDWMPDRKWIPVIFFVVLILWFFVLYFSRNS